MDSLLFLIKKHNNNKTVGYCQGSVVCVMCSRLMCPYLVCFLSSLSVIMS